MCNPSICNCESNKACKIGEYFNIKNCSYERHFFGKLVLAFEDEVLYTTNALRDDKKSNV